MKKILYKFLLCIALLCLFSVRAQAVEFRLLVLPVDIFSVCENYYCFPEVSEIVASDIIQNLKMYKNVYAPDLSVVRANLGADSSLKYSAENVLSQFKNNDKVDFNSLQALAKAFDVKSVLLINSYAINDKMTSRGNLWKLLEISSAFQIRYPLYLKTSAILTDCVNNLIMWSGKYSKDVSDSDGYFSALGQLQAYSQLEKIKQYSKINISQNVTQGVYTRFFPRDVRTFNVSNKSSGSEQSQSHFVPNALEHLSNPHMQKEYDKFNFETQNSADDFIFEF